ncbi:MAG: type I methionyl aminopeptidase, partial [Chloroflexi bacterium]
MVTLKTKDETAKMREAGRIVAEVLASCRAAVRPGVTTGELDKIAADILKRRGATSNFKGYGVPVLPPFPGVICTSVNEQVVHGIPGKRKLGSGDIISIDAGAIVDGWHADAAITVPVGDVSPVAEKLIATTEEALRRAIAAAHVGKRLGDIGATVQRWVESQGFSIVRNY